MTTPEIPQKAISTRIPYDVVELAARAMWNHAIAVQVGSRPTWDEAVNDPELAHGVRTLRREVRAGLEAASPRLKAQGVREAVEVFEKTADPTETALGGQDYPMGWLRAHADELEAQA